MALEGSIKDFGLADILQLIYFQRKTGVLALESRMDRVRLFFLEGNVVGAESKRRMEDNRLGKVLVKKGLMNEQDLKAVLDEQRRSGLKLGTALIQKGLVPKEQVQDILNSQITETVLQLFGWKQGTYEFTTQGVPQDKELAFSLDTQHLLMEGLRIVDELSVIKDRLTLDTLFTRTGGAEDTLTDEEKEVLGYVDGESDVSTIVDLTGRDNYEVSRTLLALMEKGLIASADAAPVMGTPAGPAAHREEAAAPIPRVVPYLLVLIALVLSFAVVAVRKDNSFRILAAAREIDRLRLSIDEYRMEHNALPPALPVTAGITDPWGKQYIYAITDSTYTVRSSGPDRTDGTRDDIY